MFNSDADLTSTRDFSAGGRFEEHGTSPTRFTSNPSGSVEQREKQIPILDFDGAMKRLGNDVELYKDFVGYFVEDIPQLLKQARVAIAQQDAKQLELAAHSVKGLSANLGAEAVVAAAATLEHSGRARTFDDATTQFLALEGELARLDRVLDPYRR